MSVLPEITGWRWVLGPRPQGLRGWIGRRRQASLLHRLVVRSHSLSPSSRDTSPHAKNNQRATRTAANPSSPSSTSSATTETHRNFTPSCKEHQFMQLRCMLTRPRRTRSGTSQAPAPDTRGRTWTSFASSPSSHRAGGHQQFAAHLGARASLCVCP